MKHEIVSKTVSSISNFFKFPGSSDLEILRFRLTMTLIVSPFSHEDRIYFPVVGSVDAVRKKIHFFIDKVEVGLEFQ